MNFQTEAKKEIEFIISETGLTQGEISVRAGYAEQTLTQMLSTSNVSGRMMKNIRNEFKDVFKNSIEDKEVADKVKNNNTDKTNKPEPENRKPNEEFYIETINDLRKTGINLSETNKEATIIGKETATANRILAENQQSLIEILKIMHKTTADAAKETHQDPAVQLRQCLEKIAAGGVPQYWKSENEGLAILGRFLSESQEAG